MEAAKKFSVQQTLYEMAKPSLFIVKLVGYFPYTLNESYELTFTTRSHAFLWSAFLMTIVTIKAVVYNPVRGLSYLAKLSQLDPVERFCQLILSFVGINGLVLLTARGILTVRKATEFWRMHYNHLETFANLGPSFEFFKETCKYRMLFRSIKRQAWIFAVATGIYGLYIPMMNFVLKTDPSGLNKQVYTTSNETGLVMLIMTNAFQVQSSIAYLYVGLTAYMIFFLQVYCALLTIVDQELKRIVSQVNNENGVKFLEKSLRNPNPTELISDGRMRELGNCLRGYALIEELIDAFSKHFSLEIIFETVKSCVCVLTYAFFFISREVTLEGIVICFGPMVALSWRMFALASATTKVRQHSAEILRHLYRLDLDMVTSSIRKKAHMTAMRVATSPLKIMPGAFFTLDRELIVSILSAMTTYVIILIQFRITEQG